MNTNKLYLLVLTLGALVLSVLITACGFRPTPTPVLTPTPSPTLAPSPLPANGSISGRVWDDLCTVAGGTGGDQHRPPGGHQTLRNEAVPRYTVFASDPAREPAKCLSQNIFRRFLGPMHLPW